MKTLWEALDRHFVVRRLALLVLLALTWRGFEWAMSYAATSPRTGVDLAAVIAAVTAPLAWLQKTVVELYNAARAGGGDASGG